MKILLRLHHEQNPYKNEWKGIYKNNFVFNEIFINVSYLWKCLHEKQGNVFNSEEFLKNSHSFNMLVGTSQYFIMLFVPRQYFNILVVPRQYFNMLFVSNHILICLLSQDNILICSLFQDSNGFFFFFKHLREKLTLKVFFFLFLST